jgi:hypothetical protein
MPRRRSCLLIVTLTAAVVCADRGFADESAPSFRRDVMAVLSKAGCNQGTCHGNANGKGGFKLSLRGEDPSADYQVLTRDATGRRVNRMSPEESLILAKPTLETAHEGGARFRDDSPEYRILHDWIVGGARDDAVSSAVVTGLSVEPRQAIVSAPEDRVALRVTAVFADGSSRDVTRWVVYESSQPIVGINDDGLVRRTELGEVTIAVRYLNQQVPVWLAFISESRGEWAGPQPRNRVDEFVFGKLKSLRINPAPICDDVTFLRRVYLDLLGLMPTAEEARRFVASASSEKRRELIDELLERPEFADLWALKWADLLRSEEKTLDRKGIGNLQAWLRVKIANDEPWNGMVHELLSARGSTYSEPAANYYRALRDPVVRAETTAQVFLGVRLQCAKCHSHPFDRWTQNDYYAWANAFSQIDYKVLENNRRDTNDKHEFDGEQIVFIKSNGELKDPRTGEPRPPRMLDPTIPPLAEDADRLEELADWVVSEGNPYFAKAQANRVWFHLMGRGLVDPIDDFRITNPASHPELLDWLAEEFVGNGYRLKPLVRTIMNSATYQLACETNETNAADAMNYSHAVPRRLTAEAMADALAQVLDVPVEFKGYPDGTRAAELAGVGPMRSRDGQAMLGDRFLKTFGKPPRLQSCECERIASPTLAQTFQLVSGSLIDEMLSAEKNRIGAWMQEGRSDSDMIRELYVWALSREPSESEFKAALERTGASVDAEGRRRTLEDLAWALVNSNEFLFRR